MNKFKVLDLFSGIGGFSLGLERTGGFEIVAFCEIEPYCRRVLAKHWPKVKCYDDIRILTAGTLYRDGIRPDVITGGFPCQDISTAGKQAGITGERSGLWSELCRLIGELRPRYAILENVSALLSGSQGQWFGKVLGDLAEVGFDAEWHCIPASALGAPHRRDRVWIIAHSNSRRGRRQSIGQSQCSNAALSEHDGSAEFVAYGNSYGESVIPIHASQVFKSNTTHSNSAGLQIRYEAGNSGQARTRIIQGGELERAYTEIGQEQWATEPDVGRVANGVPSRVDRLRGLGNAVVPQIPELIGRAILEHDPQRN